MSEPFIGQIQMFGFGFAPRGWSTCDGQILSISQNTALFSLLGTTFGGDGRTSFALPDLRGRDAIHVGTGPGLPTVSWGQRGGTHNVPIAVANLPGHTHTFKPRGNTGGGDDTNPAGRFPGESDSIDLYADTGNTDMGEGTTASTGGGTALNVTEPFLGIFHCIALTGIFPSRN